MLFDILGLVKPSTSADSTLNPDGAQVSVEATLVQWINHFILPTSWRPSQILLHFLSQCLSLHFSILPSLSRVFFFFFLFFISSRRNPNPKSRRRNLCPISEDAAAETETAATSLDTAIASSAAVSVPPPWSLGSSSGSFLLSLFFFFHFFSFCINLLSDSVACVFNFVCDSVSLVSEVSLKFSIFTL